MTKGDVPASIDSYQVETTGEAPESTWRDILGDIMSLSVRQMIKISRNLRRRRVDLIHGLISKLSNGDDDKPLRIRDVLPKPDPVGKKAKGPGSSYVSPKPAPTPSPRSERPQREGRKAHGEKDFEREYGSQWGYAYLPQSG